MNEDRIKEVEEKLKELQIKYDNYEYSDTGWDKNPYAVPIAWHRTELNILHYPVEVERRLQGFLVTTDAKQFWVTPYGKWKVKGRKGKNWYRYKTIDHLMENYLLKND